MTQPNQREISFSVIDKKVNTFESVPNPVTFHSNSVKFKIKELAPIKEVDKDER